MTGRRIKKVIPHTSHRPFLLLLFSFFIWGTNSFGQCDIENGDFESGGQSWEGSNNPPYNEVLYPATGGNPDGHAKLEAYWPHEGMGNYLGCSIWQPFSSSPDSISFDYILTGLELTNYFVTGYVEFKDVSGITYTEYFEPTINTGEPLNWARISIPFPDISCSQLLIGSLFQVNTFEMPYPVVLYLDNISCLSGCGADFTPNHLGGAVFEFIPNIAGEYNDVLWDFGDGTISTALQPTHHFPDGCYEPRTVTLYVDCASGDLSSNSETVFVTPSNDCPAPKAIVWQGSIGGIEESFNFLQTQAILELEERGWIPIEEGAISHPDAQGHLEDLVQDPCVRGVYIAGHGGRPNGGNGAVHLTEEYYPSDWLFPEELGAALGGRELDFLSIIACEADVDEWTSQVNVPETAMNIGDYSFYNAIFPWSKTIHSRWQKRAMENMDHGVDELPCQTSKQSDFENIPIWEGGNKKTGCECLPLCELIDQDWVCGCDLYPVSSCSEYFGPATNGWVDLFAQDNMFEISAFVTGSPTDTFSGVASYFHGLPEGYYLSDYPSIGRYLWFILESDNSASAEITGIEVTVRYDESDLVDAGIQDESSLGVFVLFQDTEEFEFVESTINSDLNEVMFSVGESAIVGIYEIPASGVEHDSVSSRSNMNPVLHPAWPNPFNPQTTISFDLPYQGAVRLAVYDVSGRFVDMLLDGETAAQGRNEVVWRGRDIGGRVVSAGVYFYRLETGNYSETKRMMLIK